MPKRVVIDCFSERAKLHRNAGAVVVVDVIRATTTAVTAVALGRQCFVVATADEAMRLAPTLREPLLVGELAGAIPDGFHLNNSPAELSIREDVERPMILLSTSGTQLMTEATAASVVYVACLRNYGAQAAALAKHDHVAVLGAGSRGEFREEDALCCAWIADELMARGHVPNDETTAALVARWRNASVEVVATGKSAEYLRRTGQTKDLEFVMAHVDDIDTAFRLERAGGARSVIVDTPHPVVGSRR